MPRVPAQNPRISEAAVKRWAKKKARESAAVAASMEPLPAQLPANTKGITPSAPPPLPEGADWWALRLRTRQSDVGYFMALFPWVDDAQVRERFGFSQNTLDSYKQSDAYRSGYQRGLERHHQEQEDAARGFFNSRVLDYAKRLDELAMSADGRVALTALTRILESQGALDQKSPTVMAIAIQLQQNMAEQLSAPARVIEGTARILTTGEVIAHGESKEGQAQGLQPEREGQVHGAV